MHIHIRIFGCVAISLALWACTTAGGGGGAPVNLSGAGESCQKSADCILGLKCIATVCAVPGADVTAAPDADATTGADAVAPAADSAADAPAAGDASAQDTSIADVVSSDVPAASCSGHCGAFATGAACQCDFHCADRGDCCADKTTLCPACTAGGECDDSNACTTDSCAKTGCVNAPITCAGGAACDKASGCPLVTDCKLAADCTQKPCQAAACTAGKCSYSPAAGACDDGNACTDGDSCQGGVCTGGAAKVCNDGNACTTDGCDGVIGCAFTNNTASCDNGDACKGDVCSAGKCASAQVCSSCSLDIDANGGTLLCGGMTLAVPAGALAAKTTLTMEPKAGAVPGGYTAYSDLVHIGPDNVAFAKAAQLTVPLSGDGSLAAAFWSAQQAGPWTWQGGALAGKNFIFNLATTGWGFVADGVNYAATADKSCAKLHPIEMRALMPGNIAAFFSVDDCGGNPITDLTDADLVLLEDGKALSKTESAATLMQKKGVGVFITISMDFSASTLPFKGQLVAAAKALVTQIQVTQGIAAHIGIEVFAGDKTAKVWQTHTLDTNLLLSQLDALSAYTPTTIGTNLYGAVKDGLSNIATAETAFRTRNKGGAFSTGYVVLFTDGADTTGYFSDADATKAEAASPDQVLAVGLQSSDFDLPALKKIAPFGVNVAYDTASLTTAFQALGTRIAGQVKRTYLIGYCTPKKAGSHTLSIDVAGNTNPTPAPAVFQFDATPFAKATSVCSAADFTTACDGKECGGLGCGACDDKASVCDGSSCQSFCDGYVVGGLKLSGTHCGLQSFTNPLGYAQSCADAPTRTWCGGPACADTTGPAFASPKCGDCVAPFAGPQCDGCAQIQFLPPDCQSSCSPAFTGIGCNQCMDSTHFALPDCTTTCKAPFAGQACLECADSKFLPPDCASTCSPLFTGPGCAQCVVPGLSLAECQCAVDQEAIVVDDGGIKKLVCAPDAPVWGVVPLNPTVNLTDNGDGTVSDSQTKLTWQKDTSGINIYMSWKQAQAYCQTLVLAGKADWRLPTEVELQTTIDWTADGKKGTVFALPFTTATSDKHLLSVTPWIDSIQDVAKGGGMFWGVDFNAGFSSYQGVYAGSQARCVR